MSIETEAPAAGPAPLAPPRQAFIERSHQRSAALGLKRHEKSGLDPLIRSDLNLARERNHRLYAHAAPVMQLLYEQIVNTESMIVLTDAQGTILHAVGDDSFLARAHRVALAPGENWAEHAKGTNAIGTALFEEKATLVHGGEHFIHANSFLTCSASPIFDPRGNMLGVLDVTGDHRGYHQHTMGLVRMSARMIENHWLSDDYNNRLRLHFHSRPEFIGTLLEGILVVSPEGRLMGANRAALDQLAMSGAELRARSLSSLFGTTPAAIYDHFRMPLSPPMQLTLPTGQSLFVSARFDWPSRPVVAGMRGANEADLSEAREVRDAPPAAPLVRDGDWGGPPACAAAAADATGTQRFSGLQYLRTGDPQLETVIQKVRRVLDRGIPLLILGETGTGKELLARAVHHDSNRARQPFVAVNCASIPESLIEAELFGYEEGAFTGARRKGAPGRLVQANGGTLFLDEIGDMPLPLQARLLRALQERSVTPLGSTKSIAVDIAVIGATHRNLRDMIAAQTFREDLYYRLNGLALRLPALRERTDIEAIVRRILQAERPQDTPELSPQVLGMFRRYQWPGNIRQLANVLRTAAVMSAGERLVTTAHLSDDFLEDMQQVGGHAVSIPTIASPVFVAAPVAAPMPAWPAYDAAPALPVQQPAFATAEPATARTLEQAEIDMIRATLDAVGGNISLASKQLGISRNTIYRKLRWNTGDKPEWAGRSLFPGLTAGPGFTRGTRRSTLCRTGAKPLIDAARRAHFARHGSCTPRGIDPTPCSHVPSPPAGLLMKLLVLGSGAGGGFPLWNCHCTLCSAWRRGDLDASARTQSSIALSQDGRPGEGWLLINASPDLLQQIRDTPALQPGHASDVPIRAVMLLDSRLHHVAGLLSLRESRELEVYATPLVFEDLTAELPLLHVLESYCRVRWRMLPIAGDTRSAEFEIPGFPALSFSAVAVPARAPRHARLRSDAAGECIALQVQDRRSGRRLFLSPALAEVGEAELAWMREADCVIVDGTFWHEQALQDAGVGSLSASDKGHLPQRRHGERPGMIDALRASGAPRKVLTHIHHSNPILDHRGAQRRELTEHGIEVAHDGMEIDL